MPIDYLAEAEKYRPLVISTLLIGEAPPPSGTVYFYVPRAMPTTQPVENDANLPATIFNHYFGTRPRSSEEYIKLLSALKDKGIFLVDICDEPLKVRGSDEGLCRIIHEIPHLRSKLKGRGIAIAEESMVFLLARRNYKSHIRCEFPAAQCLTWKKFRTEREAIHEA
ncbi:MAG: hypothetical protein ACLQHK_06935 [Gallionellaceae bacterium]